MQSFKLILLLNFLLFVRSSPVLARTDTVLVTHSATTYLLFNEPVELVDVGLPGAYLAKIEGKSVFLKAARPGVSPTTLLVKSGEVYYTAHLQYRALPQKTLYDLRAGRLLDPQPVAGNQQRPLPVAELQTRLAELAKMKHTAVIRSQRRGEVRLSLLGVLNDQGATYLKLSLRNRSSIPYTLDYVGFERIEKRGRRFSRNNTDRQETLPLVAVAPALVAANKDELLLYALSQYAFGRGGKLLITVRESSGARLFQLKIPGSTVNRASFMTRRP